MKSGRIVISTVLGLSLLAGGCQSVPPMRDSEGKRLRPINASPPPGMIDQRLGPLEPEAQMLANMSLQEVLKSLPRPDYLDQTPYDSTHETHHSEPPLAAQKAYLAARRAWLNGDSAQAKTQLEIARRLAPTEPTLLRLLGEVYTRTGNRIKGAQYFRQAVEIDPDDPRSIYILGRFAIEKGEFDTGIVLFHEVLMLGALSPHSDPALMELTHHFLANALRNAGYAQAAIEQVQAYLMMAESPIHASQFARDQALLRRQIGVTCQMLGDLYMQVGEPRSALESYDRAAILGVADLVRLDKRRVLAALRVGDRERSRRLVVDLVQRQHADAQSLAMVRYLTQAGISLEALSQDLQAVYLKQKRPAGLAIAAADVMTETNARKLLREHLEHAPQDRVVYQRLLTAHILANNGAAPTPKALAEAVKLTAEMMATVPGLADAYGTMLVMHVNDTPTLLQVIDDADSVKLDPTMRDVLGGLCLATMYRYEEAQQRFEKAVKSKPDLAVARVELAKALIVQGAFKKAQQVLKPLEGSTETGVVLLRSRVLAETGQAEQAVGLIDSVLRQSAGDTSLVITKANLLIKLNRFEDAEQALLDALNADPDAEPLYEALLDLYDPPQTGVSPITDQTAKWRVLVKRLLGTIPNSRTGRLVQAQLYDAGRNYDRAEQILLELLSENANDGRALNQLLDTYHAAGRTGEAITLLEERLEASPNNVNLLRMALRFYRESGEQDRLMQTQERVVMLEPESVGRSMRLGFIYHQWGKPQQAVDILDEAFKSGEQLPEPVGFVSLLSGALEDVGRADDAEKRVTEAIKRFPDHEADLRYMQSMIANRQGDPARGEKLLRENVKKFKDHGMSNNGLGYAMLMRNEKPGEALKLIQRAVDSDPTNEAYMDSLGWAYYKLGRFAEAENWLRRSRDEALNRARQGGNVSATLAVISDHLGDTLYRAERAGDAVRAWAEAGRYVGNASAEDLASDPELATLQSRVTEKIKAVRNKQDVPVAQVVAVKEKPKPEPKPEPKPKPKPEPKPQADPEPKADKPKPKEPAKLEPEKVEPKPAPEAKPAPESKPAPAPKPKAEPKPKQEKQPAPAPKPEPEPKPKPEPEPKPAPKPEEPGESKPKQDPPKDAAPEPEAKDPPKADDSKDGPEPAEAPAESKPADKPEPEPASP